LVVGDVFARREERTPHDSWCPAAVERIDPHHPESGPIGLEDVHRDAGSGQDLAFGAQTPAEHRGCC
jgi:hypothetical protein